jgi:hypothetical protein
MTQEKLLMKITHATFGLGGYQEAQLGLHLTFSGKSQGVSKSYAHWDYESIEHSDNCKWEENDRTESLADVLRKLSRLLKDAKVSSVDRLVGVPVEVTLEANTFSDFRILTEVL